MKLPERSVTISLPTVRMPPSAFPIFSLPSSNVILTLQGFTVVTKGMCPAIIARSPSAPRSDKKRTFSLKRSPSGEEIASKNYSLIPSRYIEFVDRDTEIDYATALQQSAGAISDLLRRQKDNAAKLENAFKLLGYEIK